MKKIYIFAAVLALLTLSLNAQLQARKNVVAKSTTTNTEKGDIRPDALFRMGPSRASTVPVTPPYSNGFDSNDEWNWWETIDVDGDGNANNGNGMWTLYNNQARYRYHSSDPADDWLITAPVTLKAGKIYKFSFLATTSSGYDERLEVKLASSNTATALSNGTEIIPSTAFRASGGRTFSNENITVSADGNYYFGIHAISDADMNYLYIDNVVIDVEITDPTIQTSASSVTMNSIPGGTVTETVTVTGKYLTDVITTSISGTNAAMFSVSPASLGTSGGELTISYTPTAVGSHTATLTLSSTDADDVTVTLNGTASNDLTICDGNNTNYHLPIYGNYAEQLQVNQMIYPEITSLIGKDITSMTFYVDGTLNSKLGDDNWVVKLGTTNQTGYTSRTRLVPDDIQEVYSGYLTTGSNTLTITFDTPFHYNGGNLLVDFEETTTSGDYTSTSFFGVSQSESTGFYSYSNNASGGLEEFLPKVTFTFEDSEPRHDLAIALTEPAAVVAGETATITATVTNNGNQTETGYTVTINGTSQTATEPLAPGATATFTYDYTTSTAGTVTITANVACTDDADATNDNATTTLTVNAQVHDLGIALNAPATVVGGNSATVTATVTNTGNQPVAGYTVTITDGTNTLLNQTVNEVLAPGATATYTADYASTEAQVGTTVSFTATVACTDDADANNNSATASMEVITMPAPQNVVATPNHENHTATVTWDAPSNLPTTVTTVTEPVTESFENGTDGWTFIDSDGDGYNWILHNNSTESSQMIVNTGNCVVYSESYHNNESGSGGTALNPNNWLISPEVTLDGTLSLYACGQDANGYHNEVFGVYICVGDYNGISSFEQVGADVTTTHDMTEYTYDLSQYQGQLGHIAIVHHNVTDQFILNIDDVTYQVTNTSEVTLAPTSYNVYLDGQLEGSVNANDPLTYDFSNLTEGDHTVEISAVYPGGIESAKVPAQFTIMEKTATPTISVVTNADGSKTVTATGNGTVHLYVDGVEQSNPYTIMPSVDGDITVTVTATAQEDGKLISDTATETVTVPEAGRSPQPTITFTDNGDGSYTITVTGTGEVAVYIDDAEHGNEPIAVVDNTFSFNVEQHSQAMSITVVATNQEEGLEVSRPVTETYPIPAMTIDGTFQTLDPQPANASTPIDLSKVMFVDRFRKVIPFENNHPRLYDYYLQETQVRQRTSNSIPVEVKHTGSDGLGFYSLNQIDNDTVRTLKMDVRNAAMEMALESDPGIYYYYGSRSTVAYPDQADRKYLGVLQHTTDDYYTETLNPSYDYQQSYPGGTPHIHLDTDTILGEYNDYLMYVPQVMTMGFDRVLYETDHLHNSYGAPKWKTGVADVYVNAVDAERQVNSASTTWNDNGKKISMYMLTVNATGVMPTVNTMPYEPYMFRVFVESNNGKLRNWKYVDADSVTHTGSHYEAAPGTTEGPICVWSEYVKNSPYVTINGNEVYFVKTKVEERDSLGNWVVPCEMNIMFAAEDDMDTAKDGNGNEYIIEDDLKIYVRFYYIVEGAADNHTPIVHGQRPRGEGDAPAGYGSESPGTPPSPSTGVKEMTYYGDVVSTTYYNVQGMSSSTPFDGINIVVMRYSNGATRTIKVVR